MMRGETVDNTVTLGCASQKTNKDKIKIFIEGIIRRIHIYIHRIALIVGNIYAEFILIVFCDK